MPRSPPTAHVADRRSPTTRRATVRPDRHRRRARSPNSRWRSSRRAGCRGPRPGLQFRRPIACRRHARRSLCRPAQVLPTRQMSPAARPTTTPGRRWGGWRSRPAPSGSLRKLREVRLSFLHVGVPAFLCLFAHVVEERRVARELLDAGQPVVGRVEPGLEHAQRQGTQLEHAAAPCERLLFELSQRNDLVHESHVERLLRVVLLAEEPDLARFLLPHDARKKPRPVAAVEASDARPGLAETRIVGRDGEVAAHMQAGAAADRVSRDHRDHRLGQTPDLDLEVQHVQPAGALRIDVPVVATDALIAPRAKRFGSGTGEDDHADGRVVAGDLERLRHLEDGRGTKRVADLGPVDRDLGYAVPGVVEDVLVLAGANPVSGLTFQAITPRAITSTISDATPREWLDALAGPLPRKQANDLGGVLLQV